MRPLVAEEAGDAPEHAQRLDRAGCFGFAHVGCFPAELIENTAHRRLRRLVVPADEHGWLAALVLRVDHARIADGIEGFDEAYGGKLPLQALHEGLVERGEESQHSIDGRLVCEWIRRVDDGFSGEI